MRHRFLLILMIIWKALSMFKTDPRIEPVFFRLCDLKVIWDNECCLSNNCVSLFSVHFQRYLPCEWKSIPELTVEPPASFIATGLPCVREISMKQPRSRHCLILSDNISVVQGINSEDMMILIN